MAARRRALRRVSSRATAGHCGHERIAHLRCRKRERGRTPGHPTGHCGTSRKGSGQAPLRCRMLPDPAGGTRPLTWLRSRCTLGAMQGPGRLAQGCQRWGDPPYWAEPGATDAEWRTGKVTLSGSSGGPLNGQGVRQRETLRDGGYDVRGHNAG